MAVKYTRISREVGPVSGTPGVEMEGIEHPSAGWEHFYSVKRLRYETVDSWIFRISRVNVLRYQRQFGFCTWDKERLLSWGVLNPKYGPELDAPLRCIWCGWIPEEGVLSCCKVSRRCTHRSKIDPRFSAIDTHWPSHFMVRNYLPRR